MLDRTSPLVPGSAPPRPGAKREFAGARLREAVMSCELAPGAKVSEGSLMALYGLNRAGIRAGLLRLEGEGLVEALPRHGWRIRPVTGAYIGEVVAARRALEAAIPVDTLNEEQIARLGELGRLTAVLAGRAEAGSRASLRACDRELMDTLVGGLGEIRRRWLGEIWDHAERLVAFFERTSRRRHAPADRRALVEACRARDQSAARDALAGAIDEFESFVISALYAQDAEIVSGDQRSAARPARAKPAMRQALNERPQASRRNRGTIEWVGEQDS